MNLIGKRARKASQYKIDTKVKNSVLASYAKMLDENKGLICLLYTSPSPRDGLLSRMPSSA